MWGSRCVISPLSFFPTASPLLPLCLAAHVLMFRFHALSSVPQIPNMEINKEEDRLFSFWDRDNRVYTVRKSLLVWSFFFFGIFTLCAEVLTLLCCSCNCSSVRGRGQGSHFQHLHPHPPVKVVHLGSVLLRLLHPSW